jgi:hypothetical protein
MKKITLYLACATILLAYTHQQYAQKKRVDRAECIEQLNTMQEQLDAIKDSLAQQEEEIDKRFFGLDMLSTLSCERETLDNLLESAPYVFEQVLAFLSTFVNYVTELPGLIFDPSCACDDEYDTTESQEVA